MSDSRESYAEHKARLNDQQAVMSPDEIEMDMRRKSESVVNLDNLPDQQHNWVDRGTVMSCEGAGHANHHAYKIRNR